MKLALRPRKGRLDGVTVQEFAEVDEEDYEELSQYVWYFKVDNAGSSLKMHKSVGRPSMAGRDTEFHKKGSHVLMSRHILGIDDPSIIIQHKNGNPLDCRKCNLRVVLDGYAVLKLRDHWYSNTDLIYRGKR